MIDEDAIRYRWNTVGSQLDERGRRLFAAAEARTAGRGGLAIVSRIIGLRGPRSTVARTDLLTSNWTNAMRRLKQPKITLHNLCTPMWGKNEPAAREGCGC